MKAIWLALIPFGLVLAGCSCGTVPASKPPPTSAHQHAVAAKADNAITLFDGVSIKNWKETNFGGEGDVLVDKGQLILSAGSPLTGVTWTGLAMPLTNFEVSL